MTSDTITVRTDCVGKTYGAVVALDDVSIAIADNEFFVLLGPSGCGKTTLLRCIGGFETVSSGRILLYDKEIDNLPPHLRPINTVFQHYALFPHMTVADNIAFGPRMLKRDAAVVKNIVRRMLDLVHMSEFAGRHPAQLSGGQQQRVALARALASEPKVLLLDEPLSALDLKLRQAMRVELKQLQEETGITFILVTHDQEEALTMGDRIAVMSNGALQQTGTPQQIYEQPVNHFVADFIGETNFLTATIESVEANTARCALAGGAIITAALSAPRRRGERVTLSVRPEKISITPQQDGDETLNATVTRLVYLGTDTHYQVSMDAHTSLTVRVQNGIHARAFQAGELVGVAIDPAACRVLAD